MQDLEIYCDLDGVLVDLAGKMQEFYGVDYESPSFTSNFFALMDKLNNDEKIKFWSNLQPRSDYMKLWNFIKKFNPFILTSCSKMISACIGKKKWCLKHIGVSDDKIICVPKSSTKQNYAQKNRILIDDLPSNIHEWENKGGIGVLHKNANDTVKFLKNLLYTKYDTYDI